MVPKKRLHGSSICPPYLVKVYVSIDPFVVFFIYEAGMTHRRVTLHPLCHIQNHFVSSKKILYNSKTFCNIQKHSAFIKKHFAFIQKHSAFIQKHSASFKTNLFLSKTLPLHFSTTYLSFQSAGALHCSFLPTHVNIWGT